MKSLLLILFIFVINFKVFAELSEKSYSDPQMIKQILVLSPQLLNNLTAHAYSFGVAINIKKIDVLREKILSEYSNGVDCDILIKAFNKNEESPIVVIKDKYKGIGCPF